MLDARLELKEMREIIISDELLQQLEELPIAKAGQKKMVFTPEEDQVLLKYWGVKKQSDIARVLSKSIGVCRNRYESLIGEEHER